MRFDYIQADTIICTYCKHDHKDSSDDLFWHDYSSIESKSHSENEERHIECENCNKLFLVEVDKHNVNEGFRSFMIRCDKLKQKHSFKYKTSGQFECGSGKIDFKRFECKKCGESKYKDTDSDGKILTALQSSVLRKKLSKTSVIVDKKEKEIEIVNHHSELFNRLTINFFTKSEAGNQEISDILHQKIIASGFKKVSPQKEEFMAREYYDLNNKGVLGIFSYNIKVHQMNVEFELQYERDLKLNYLQNKKIELIQKNLTKEIQRLYPLAKLKESEKMTWHNKPNIHYYKNNEDRINHIISHPSKEVLSGSNAKDQDGVLLTDGETRYFYYQNRLMRGQVYHNINNMWWVIINKHQFTNLGSHNLFKYTPNLKLKIVQSQEDRIKIEIKKESNLNNFEKCVILQKKLNRLLAKKTQ